MEKIWLKHYSPGVPTDIDLDEVHSVGHYFQEAVRDYADNPAFISGATGTILTYRVLDRLTRHLAAYFTSVLKLPPGTRVAIMMPNLLQYPVCIFGLLRAGYVIVNVNPLYTARELEHQLKDSGAEAIIIVDAYAHTLAKIVGTTAIRHIVVTGLADMMSAPKRLLANFVIHRVKKAIPAYDLPGAVPFLTALSRGAGAPYTPVEVKPDDLAFLQYTGGTTGVSKGAMLSHFNVMANVKQVFSWVEPFLDRSEPLVAITAIPLYHIFALGSCLSFLGSGGANVLIADPRNIPAFVKVLSRYRFVSLPAVNTLFNSLINHKDFARVDFSRLRVAIGGGAAVQSAVAERFRKITGAPIIEGYGLTECSPSVTVNPMHIGDYTGAIGLPLPSTEISIRDDQGRELGLGESGELCVRGPQVMRGYWNRPAETAAVMTEDGFLKTGDLATIDERGFLRIVDRKKDMILVSGFNVYPNEIEEVVSLHPAVLEVAAVGKPSPTSGEHVKLFVVKKDPALTSEALLLHCRENLTAYKIPREIEFLDDLPKSNVGKILRRELRERDNKP